MSYVGFGGGWIAKSPTTGKQFVRVKVDQNVKLFLYFDGRLHEIELFQQYYNPKEKKSYPPFKFSANCDAETEVSWEEAQEIAKEHQEEYKARKVENAGRNT